MENDLGMPLIMLFFIYNFIFCKIILKRKIAKLISKGKEILMTSSVYIEFLKYIIFSIIYLLLLIFINYY